MLKLSVPKDLIGKVLSPAVRLWLRSQVESVQDLQFRIIGQDRQILGGYVPEVFVSSQKAVYQGLHLTEVQLTGTNIRINLGQILKGKALRLLEPIIVNGYVLLRDLDLQASLSSPLLAQGITDLLFQLITDDHISKLDLILQDIEITWQQVTIESEKLTLRGEIRDNQGKITPLTLRSGLSLSSPQHLFLHPLQIEALPHWSLNYEQGFAIDLGENTALERLTLSEGLLSCYGSLKVVSDDSE